MAFSLEIVVVFIHKINLNSSKPYKFN